MKTVNNSLVKTAFVKSLPVMAGYIVLGIGFGILLNEAGFGPLWALLMSLLVFAGSMQFVGVSLISGGRVGAGHRHDHPNGQRTAHFLQCIHV